MNFKELLPNLPKNIFILLRLIFLALTGAQVVTISVRLSNISVDTWFRTRHEAGFMFLFGLLKGKAYNSWRLLFHTSWSHHLFTTSRVKQKVSTSITPLLAPETKPSSVPGSLNRPWRMWICWKIIQYKLTQKNWFLAHIINLSKLQDHFSVSFYCFQLEFKIIWVVSLFSWSS